MTTKDFPTGEYKCVVIDPPWDMMERGFSSNKDYAWYRKNGWGSNAPGYDKALPYNVMDIEDIAALPVAGTLAADAWLFCWTTMAYLPKTFDLLAGWECRYRFLMTWHKPNGPKLPIHPMYNGEYCVVGSRGQPKFTNTKAFYTVFNAPRRDHSVKPAEFYNTLVRVTEPPRLDIFSRRLIPGFDVWGDEAPTQVLENSQYLLFGDST